jgi:protein MAK11
MTAASKAKEEPIVAPPKKVKTDAPTPKPAASIPKDTIALKASKKAAAAPDTTTIQIITGSYDRILHGITASFPTSSVTSPSPKTSDKTVTFADTFLFTAHTSAIRTLALSPPSAPTPHQPQKILLATGSTDSKVNLYHISAHPPQKTTVPVIPSLTSRAVVENPSNRELGTLVHHNAAVTDLCFPTRGKLLSASEDCTIAVTRTRDWSLLSTIKAPIPKSVGRPSGDTAPIGGAPAGVNAFAVHPSLKLMLSVGRGEKNMRLWNLVTGKKAGVLNFTREVLTDVGEGRHGLGEGRKVVWGQSEDGEEFAVAFEWGVCVWGMDCKVRCVVKAPGRRSKVHNIAYVNTGKEDEQVLAVSTEDGRVLFFSTAAADCKAPEPAKEGARDAPTIPVAKCVAQLGGKEAGVSNRIKDFSFLPVDPSDAGRYAVVTGCSDGAVKVWALDMQDVLSEGTEGEVRQVGALLGSYETGNRVTCLEGFVMVPLPEGVTDDVMESDDEGSDEEMSDGEE